MNVNFTNNPLSSPAERLLVGNYKNIRVILIFPIREQTLDPCPVTW